MGFVLPTTYARTRIYRPRRETIQTATSDIAQFTDVQVAAADGLTLNGWHAVSQDAGDRPQPLLLYFPGTSGNRGYRVSEVEFFNRLGCEVLLFDYRGYGDNGGQPSERWQTRDARRVWEFATEELRFAPDQIVLYGESIGGAVSTRLAAELCRRGVEPAGLILQATFSCMLDVTSQFFPRWLGSLFLVDRYPSVRRIRHVTCPLLSIHGSDDRLIPIEMGRRLFAAAPACSTSGVAKTFVELPGVDHSDVLAEETGQVEGAIRDFLHRVFPGAHPGGLRDGDLHSHLTPTLQ